MSKACIELSQFAELIDRIYQSAYSPREWVESLNAIRLAFCATYATLIVRPVSGHDPGLMVNAGLADGQGGGVVPAIEYYSTQSPFIGMSSQRIFTVQDLMSEETADKFWGPEHASTSATDSASHQCLASSL